MFNLSIDTGNDAFQGRAGAETARILREIADKLDDGIVQAPVWDLNGNKIGLWSLEHRDEEGEV